MRTSVSRGRRAVGFSSPRGIKALPLPWERSCHATEKWGRGARRRSSSWTGFFLLILPSSFRLREPAGIPGSRLCGRGIIVIGGVVELAQRRAELIGVHRRRAKFFDRAAHFPVRCYNDAAAALASGNPHDHIVGLLALARVHNADAMPFFFDFMCPSGAPTVENDDDPEPLSFFV